MTAAQKQFVWLMRIFAFIYLIGAILFFFMPEETIYLINVGPKVFKMFQETPMPAERFWVALTTSMMAMLCFAALYSSLNPKIKGFVFIHLLSKAVSTLGFIYLFFRHQPYFAYALGATTDGLIFIIVTLFFLRTLSPAKETAPKENTNEDAAR